MPTIKDHRSKEVVLARLKEDERLQKSSKYKKKKKWLPAFVAIASIFILSLLVPALLRGNEVQIESARDASAVSTLEKDASLGNVENESEIYLSEDVDESPLEVESRIVKFESHILLEDELGEMRTLQVGLVSDGVVIPVTFLITAERILADFSEEEPSAVQLYNEYAATIPEEKLGFDNYHPYKGEIMEVDDVVIHEVLDGDNYDQVYLSSLQATFGGTSEHQMVEAQIEFSKPTDSIKLSQSIPPVTYYKYAMPDGQVYLVPHYGDNKNDTVKKALLRMKVSQNNNVELLVPENVQYEVDLDEGTAVIRFKELLDLSQMHHEDAMAMIEGFIVTAYHYQSTVRLENVLQKSLGKYDLESILPKSVAVNPLNILVD